MSPLHRWVSSIVLCAPVVTSIAAQEAGAPGGPGLAIRCTKALVCPPDPGAEQVVDHALVLVKDGKIESVGPERSTEVPAGYELVDVGASWLMPGMIELHAHIAGSKDLHGFSGDINDLVYLANPELKASTSVIPGNVNLRMGLAAGVTSVLYIPGSGSNMGGQGVLLKTGFDRYEEALVRDPGSLKLAQWGNPESWAMGVGMAFENWNTRNTFKRGLAYARAWKDFEEGKGPKPTPDIQWDLFKKLLAKEVQVSTHTQVYQVVLMTITMVKIELGLDVFLDHSEIGGWLAGELAAEHKVPAIVGPRTIDPASRGMINWARNRHEGVRGLAAGWQERGVELLGFNTDSSVIPEEELPMQAALGVRYGMRDDRLASIRGLTIVPALTVGLSERLGTLLPGRDADIVVISGHVCDPRSSVSRVWSNGTTVYDADEEKLW